MGDYERYLGKRLLVGITYETHRGEFIRQEQFHGPIIRADERAIVIERADGAGLMSLPPGAAAAEPAAYRLRSTGEVVRPDFVATWIFRDPPPRAPAPL
jgi:hypothetical protein